MTTRSGTFTMGRGGKAEPAAQRHNDVAERMSLRMRDLPDHLRRRARPQAQRDGLGQSSMLTT